ncbi:MAG: tetratricopeptide repeat protein [Acidobacteriota bacterium]|jgi:tetratricopeptide (TPR) repeat protein
MTMMTEHRRIVWLLALLLAIPCLTSAARKGRLIGKVVDPEGEPIPGVSVTTTSPDVADFREVTETNKKGIFKVDFEEISVVYRYQFEKAGYKTLMLEHTWDVQGTERQEFTMTPGESAAVGAQPPASTSTPAILAFNDGVRAYEAEDYATARTKLEEALGHDPDLRLAWELLSQVHLEQEDYQEAAEAAEKAVALGSMDESLLRARWEAYRHLGDEAKTAEAEEALEKVGRLTEEAKRIHNEGVALERADDHEGAYAKFQDAVEIDPTLEVAWVGLATAALETGRDAEAASAAKTILETHPQDEAALRIQYNAALNLGDEKKIVDSLWALAAVDPDLAVHNLFQMATLAFDADDAVKAKERLRKVLELSPDHPRAHYLLGLLLIREAANEEARSHLERFLELAPDDPDAATAEGALKYLKKS